MLIEINKNECKMYPKPLKSLSDVFEKCKLLKVQNFLDKITLIRNNIFNWI